MPGSPQFLKIFFCWIFVRLGSDLGGGQLGGRCHQSPARALPPPFSTITCVTCGMLYRSVTGTGFFWSHHTQLVNIVLWQKMSLSRQNVAEATLSHAVLCCVGWPVTLLLCPFSGVIFPFP